VWMGRPIADAIADGALARTAGAVVLPGFDEFVLGYKDRSVQVPDEHKNAIIPGGNGIFRSTIVVDGHAVGTWTRARKKTRIDVSMVPFEPLSVRQKSAVMKAFEHYGRYCGLPLEVV